MLHAAPYTSTHIIKSYYGNALYANITIDIHPGMKGLLFYYISHCKIHVNEKREIITNQFDHFNNHCIDIIV